MTRRFRNLTEARRYVYDVLATMLEHEFVDPEGMFGGIDPSDVPLLARAIVKIRKDLLLRARPVSWLLDDARLNSRLRANMATWAFLYSFNDTHVHTRRAWSCS